MSESSKFYKSFLFKHQIERRIPYLEVYSDGVLSYDVDNIYPQRIEELIRRSSAATRAINLFLRFIIGKGFQDKTLNKTKINRYGQTVMELLRLVGEDYSKFTGFGILVCYNAFLEKHSFYHVPFEQIRLGLPDELGRINYFKVYGDWAEEKGGIKKDKIQTIKAYNPNPEVLTKQIQKAGGIQSFKGQLFYFSPDKNNYPLASIDPIINDVDSDARLSRFKNRNIRNKFMPSAIAEYPGEFEEEEEKEQFLDDLKAFQGDEEAGSIMLVENKDAKENPLKIHPFKVENNDKVFEYHETSIKEQIRRHFVQPAVLSGEVTPGKLGNSTEFADAYEFYNSHTEDDRSIFEETFYELLKDFATPVIPEGAEELVIQKLTFGTPKTENKQDGNTN